MSEVIQFDAVVYKVSTLVDQGLRITLDLPETALIAAAQMMAAKREGMILHIEVTTDKQVHAVNGERDERTRPRSDST